MTIPATEPSRPNPRQLLLDGLENRWGSYRAELERCHAEFSNEAVHDLRVATRRMVAFIQLLNSISPRPHLRKLVRAFKDQLDEFDELRDTQVMLAELAEIFQELPQLQAFQEYLQSAERRLLRSLRKKIKKFELTEIARRIRKAQRSLETWAEAELETRIMQAVDDAFMRVKERHGAIDLARPATIHRLRVAFKSLRYMIEIVHPLLPGFPAKTFKQMNAYQTLMGEIQDAEIFDQTLADFLEHASLSDPEPVRRYVEQRHAAALSAFAKRKDHLDRFWRGAPDQPFPWERTV